MVMMAFFNSLFNVRKIFLNIDGLVMSKYGSAHDQCNIQFAPVSERLGCERDPKPPRSVFFIRLKTRLDFRLHEAKLSAKRH
jgi:hypothetical protein